MKYHQLKANPTQSKKRVGRGISAGQGKTAGRGTKGLGARTGKKISAVFMGGQRPLVQAVPKNKGFKSLRAPAQIVYLQQLEAFANKTADNHTLYKARLISNPYHAVKVIAKGELKSKVTLKVQAASASVQAALQKAGGSFEKVTVPLKMASKQKADKK